VKHFFKEKGVTLIELLVAGLILILTTLFLSGIFLHGSINIITSWEETLVLSCLQEKVEEVKSASRDPNGPYSYIVMRADTDSDKNVNHYHINIPTIVPAATTTEFTVVAHSLVNGVHERDEEQDNVVTPVWEEIEGSVTAIFPPTRIKLDNGIGYGEVTFHSTSSTSCRGQLYIQEGTQIRRNIIVSPNGGEQIVKRDLIGTRTALFELFDDPLDNPPRTLDPDLLPKDYMKGTITFTWERKGKGRKTKELVTIIAPYPE